MQHFSRVFFYCLLLILSFSFESFPQVTERKKPKIKNFGSSLRRTPQENLSSTGNKEKATTGEDDEVIKINTNLVVFDFLVLTPKGFSVSGLKREDFIITENDEPQEIQTFTIGNDASIPRSIVLIIDHSGSQLMYLNRSIEAAKLLVDKLRPNDLMAVVTDDVELIADYTNDKKKLKTKLDSLKEELGIFGPARGLGRSKQFSALYATLNEMFTKEDARPIVIFQTDGDEFLSLKGQFGHLIYAPYATQTKFSFGDLLTMTDKARTTIYTVFPGVKLLGLSSEEKKLKSEAAMRAYWKAMHIDPDSRPKPSKDFLERAQKYQKLQKKYYPGGVPDQQEVLAALSKYTGGWIDFLETPEQADEIYSTILGQIDSRYIVSFSPTDETKDGKRRTVKVSVKNHPDYIVWGRKTYLAPMPD